MRGASPTAATLHAIHYHRVDVAEQQNRIANDPTGHSRVELPDSG